MTDKKIKPTNPDTEKAAEADDTTKAAARKTAGINSKHRVSARKTSGISSNR
jgi:hypothetical protein